MKTITYFLSTVLLLAVVVSSSCNRRSVTRVNPNKQFDLSGRWNETDAQLTAETLIKKALAGDWLGNFTAQKGKKPVVVVGTVRNNSHEHVDANIFIADIEKAFLKSQAIRLVQAGEKRNELRGERADQQDFASASTVKKWGQELGADYILQGSIRSIVDSYRREKTTFWQVDLSLTDLETNEVVWLDDYKGKKYIVN
jgi:uncharacterized protein (TIGR02722 family)